MRSSSCADIIQHPRLGNLSLTVHVLSSLSVQSPSRGLVVEKKTFKVIRKEPRTVNFPKPIVLSEEVFVYVKFGRKEQDSARIFIFFA
jgi:hypothetical protein